MLTLAMHWAAFETQLLSRDFTTRERKELRGVFYAAAARVNGAYSEAIEAEDGPLVTAIHDQFSHELAHYIEGLREGRM